MTATECSHCGSNYATWTVNARVPASQTSRLGHKTFQSHCCIDCLSDVVTAALSTIGYTAPAKVTHWAQS